MTSGKSTRRGWVRHVALVVVGFALIGGYFLFRSQEKRSSEVPITAENEALCICETCPTCSWAVAVGTCKFRLYCARGPQRGIELIAPNFIPHQGATVTTACWCSSCPVYAEYGLKGWYFCSSL